MTLSKIQVEYLHKHGIDIEPNSETDILQNIYFENTKTDSNSGAGIQVYIRFNLIDPISINIKNHTDYNSLDGFNVSKKLNVNGFIKNENCFYNYNKRRGIVSNAYCGGNCKLSILSPRIENCNQAERTALIESIPIVFYNTLDTEDPVGNILIENAYLDNPKQTNQCDFAITDPQVVENVSFINPIKLRDLIRAKGELNLSDNYKQLVSNGNYDYSISASVIRSLSSNENASANRTYSLGNNLPKGLIFTIFNKNISNRTITIKLGTETICRNFSQNAGINIKLNNFGDSITFEK